MSIHRKMDNKNMVYMHNRIVLIYNKKLHHDICRKWIDWKL